MKWEGVFQEYTLADARYSNPDDVVIIPATRAVEKPS